MRIAQFTDSFLPVVDGVGRVVLNVAESLSVMGNECYVIAPMTDSGFRGGYSFEWVDFMGMKLIGQPYKLGIPEADTHFHTRMNMIELDIIHAHDPFAAGWSALSYALRRGLPLVGSFHSKYYDDFLQVTKAPSLAKAGARLVVKFYEACDEVWAVSENAAETLRCYGYTKNVVVMPNGMDIPPADPAAVTAAETAYSLGEGPLLLYVGQMNWKKNIRRILEACALLTERGTAYTLALAGQGPHAGEIADAARALGIEKQVLLTGHITDARLLRGLYQRSSLFVFPSLYDNAPMVVREAAAAGTPSVTVAGSSASEPIADGVNGLLCRDDPRDLADVLQKALSDPSALAAIGREARRTIPVSWDLICEKYIARYQRLVEDYTRRGWYRRLREP
ncbi:MAG: glycosyltransferase [Christensenellales bacterium]|jgi:1,2-diacylglycerol 3-alpha-glucosyltransferase